MNKLIISKWAKDIKSCEGVSAADVQNMAKAIGYLLRLRESYLKQYLSRMSTPLQRKHKRLFNIRDFEDIEKISGIDLR